MKIDENYPQFIKVDGKIKEQYLEPLANSIGNVFYKRELGDIYFFAAAVGFINKVKKSTEKNEDLRLYQTLQEKYKLLIRAIVLSHVKYNYEFLNEGRQVLKIIEEYANGGAPILYDKVFKGGVGASIEEELWGLLKKP